MHYIYKYTNKINNKTYIGQTNNIKNKKYRHLKGAKAHKNSLIHHAIKKYGIENFLFEILTETLSQDEANNIESQFITQLNSLAPNGYNLVNKCTVQAMSELSKQRLRKTSQCKIVKNKKDPMTEACIGVLFKNNNYYTIITYFDKTMTRRGISKAHAMETYDKCVLFLYGADARINNDHLRASYLSQDLKQHLDDFVERKTLTKNGRYRYIGPRQKNKWSVLRNSLGLSGKTSMSVKPLKIPLFDTCDEAAHMADYLIVYFNLKKPLNFPDNHYDKTIISNKIASLIKTKTSKHVGISKDGDKWMVMFNRVYLGRFNTEQEAYEVREEYIKKLAEKNIV